MARIVRVVRLDLGDDAGSGPVSGTVHVVISDDAAAAVALGMATAGDTRRVTLSRAAWNQLLSALKRPSGDSWPDGVLAHPVAKDQ